MYVVFKNKGVIDPRSIATFGVSSKEGDNPIGMFGSGLKFSLAILLRENLPVSVVSGGKQIVFCVKREALGVDEFDFIYMSVDGTEQPLAFTTCLGKTWGLEEAYRELYCNCMDEGGTVSVEEYYPDTSEDETVFVVHGQEFLAVHNNKDSIILNKTVLHESNEVQVCEGGSEHLFYRGVRAYRLEKPSKYTYNILSKLDLTEDRTIKHVYTAKSLLANYVAEVDNKEFVQRCLTAATHFEGQLDFEYKTPSSTFKDVVLAEYKNNNPALNASAFRACRNYAVGFLDGVESLVLSKTDQLRLDKAKRFLCLMDINVDEYPVIVTNLLGESTLGLAKDSKIYLAPRVFDMGVKQLAATLLEEYTHNKTGLRDETRALETYLFEKWLSMAEMLVGEVL